MKKILSLNFDIKRYFIFTFLFYISSGAFDVLIGLYMISIGYKEDFVGTIFGARVMTMAFFSIIAGILAKRWGYAVCLRLASLLSFIGCLIQVIFFSKIAIILGAILFGIGLIFVAIVEGPYIMENSPSKTQVKMFSYNYSVIMVALIIGTFFSGIVSDIFKIRFNYSESLKISMLIFTTLSFTSLIPAFLIKTQNRTLETKDEDKIHYRDYKNLKSGKWLLAYFAFMGFSAGSSLPFYNIFFKSKFQIEEYQLSALYSISQGAIIVATLAVPYLLRWIKRKDLLMLCQIAAIPFLFLIIISKIMPVAAMSFIIRHMLVNMMYPLVMNFSLQVVQDKVKTLFISFIKLFESLFRSTGSYFAGWFMSKFMYEYTFFISLAFFIIAVLLLRKSLKSHTIKKDEA